MEALKTYATEKTLREKVNETLRELKMNNQEVALKINYSRSAVSRYLNGKYDSDSTGIEKAFEDFLEEAGIHLEKQILSVKGKNTTIVSTAPNNSIIVKPIKEKVQYFESRDYIQVIGVCQACQENQGLGIVIGKSGYGKTHALRKYAALQRVVYIEGNETMNCKDIIRRIENKIGAPRNYGSIDERMERIIEFFNINQGYLLIMDEADKLINKYTQKKIELLRNISDSSHLGIVIAGEPVLESLLKGYDVRFANRMDFYYKMRGLLKKEVEAYLEEYEIEDNALTEFVARANNNQSGCFRLLDRTLNNVIRILKERGQTKVTMKIMSEASHMMML